MRRYLLIATIFWLGGCCIDVPFVPFVVDPTIPADARAAKPMAEAP